MRTKENSEFTLNKTHTRDWYEADEVDKHIAELESTRVHDKLLKKLIGGYYYKDLEPIIQAEAILAKRKECK